MKSINDRLSLLEKRVGIKTESRKTSSNRKLRKVTESTVNISEDLPEIRKKLSRKFAAKKIYSTVVGVNKILFDLSPYAQEDREEVYNNLTDIAYEIESEYNDLDSVLDRDYDLHIEVTVGLGTSRNPEIYKMEILAFPKKN